MSYYQGDYYRGDYYQGGIPSLLLRLGKAVVPKLIRGAGSLIKAGLGIAKRNPVATSIGTGVAIDVAARQLGRARGGMVPHDATMRGYHENKVLKRYGVAIANGRNVQDPRDQMRVVNEIVRNRSMNVMNPRAMKRAFTRIKGAQKWARKLVTFQRKVKIHRGPK